MNQPPKLLDQLRNAIRLKHYPLSTEAAYVSWAKRYILFHNKRHPIKMGAKHIQAFLTHLAVDKHVAAPTQNQALNGIVFLYKHVLHKDPGDFSSAVRAKKPLRFTCTARGTLPNHYWLRLTATNLCGVDLHRRCAHRLLQPPCRGPFRSPSGLRNACARAPYTPGGNVTSPLDQL
ncbi:phage integrase N-terminal SAM-like domain-containing protein [Planctomycetota bacterium]